MAARGGAENACVNAPPEAGEQCPTCGAALAPDQRYCLECGHRRGDPRLPFMDAVVFMDAVQKSKEPPPSPPPAQRDRRPLISANASLVAGVATLVLAIGVGVLIGRSGEGGSGNVAATPPIIKVGGGEEETTAAGSEEEAGKADKGKSKGKPAGVKAAAEKKTEAGDSGASKASEEVLEPAPGVKLPPPTAELGDKCEEGTSGCEDGEFNGNFFE
jgi:hypothetical protein